MGTRKPQQSKNVSIEIEFNQTLQKNLRPLAICLINKNRRLRWRPKGSGIEALGY